MAALTKPGQRCQTCQACSQVGPHFPHDCDCDWRNDGHEPVEES